MSAASAREHHWDSLRAFLMLLGIPYHAAMAYNTRVVWDIQSPDKSEFLTFVSGVFVTFRMPAFFIVAGYFAAMMLERRPPTIWLRSRLTRLGIPFLTGLALLAPLQIALIDLNGAVTGAMPMATALDRAAQDVTHPGFSWIMHLWFLPALLAYSIFVVLVLGALGQPRLAGLVQRLRRFGRASPRMALAVLTLVITAWEVCVHLSHQAMLARDGSLPYLLAHGIDPYLRYLPFFLIGVVLRGAPDLRTAFVWQKGWTFPTLAAITAILASLLRGWNSTGLEVAYNAVDGAAALLASLVAIGIAQRFWNRPDPRIDRIVDASFSIYLLHHPVIYALSTLFLLTAWPPVAEFALVCLATSALSYAAHRLIRRSPLALFLFNGVSMPRKPRDTDSPQTRITTLR
ncbi:MAG: acyltransferase family protein [Rhizobium rhizophilum]|uniref:acyltransferase family protein n=1 Tax=Rhizobium rhizophilum TaxID=1850373 RepID=UPI00391C8F64